MKEAIKQISRLISFLVFLTIFIVGYRFDLPFSLEMVLPVLLKAFAGAVIFAIGGLVVGDIIVKGIVEDIDAERLEPLEGGFEQRIHELKQKQRVSIVERQLHLSKAKRSARK